MSVSAELSAQSEDYLEAILQLVAQKGIARARDIAKRLSVHKSTVTGALRHLADKGLVNYTPYEASTLTPQGRKIAREVLRRHKTISTFLSQVLLLQKDVAEENACRMEHAVDQAVISRLLQFMEFVQACPGSPEGWTQYLEANCEHGNKRKDCRQCLALSHAAASSVPTLDTLGAGQRGAVVKVRGTGAIRRRIVEMGVVRGTSVEVVKAAPDGGPIEVKLKGYNLALRQEEAARIEVKPD